MPDLQNYGPRWVCDQGIAMTENITLGHLLHGAVSKAAQDHFIEGRYRSAVGDGIAAVFGLIRARTGLEMDGDPLATKALSLSNPRLIMGNLTTDSGKNVQKGIMFLLQGVVSAVRNPTAHSLNEDIGEIEAAQLLALLSWLEEKIESAAVVPFLRYDGVYISASTGADSGCRMLRFYEDKHVLSISASDRPKEPPIWFTLRNVGPEYGMSSGNYENDGDKIKFSVVKEQNKIDYEGVLSGPKLFLKSFSHINQHRDDVEFEFVRYKDGAAP